KPKGTQVCGVELDPTSSRIAKLLHSDDAIYSDSMENFATADTRQYDAVIGNAPFGLRGRHIKDDKSHRKTAEQYFLDAAIDKTKPGGVVGLIVPTGILDSSSAKAFREDMVAKAEFLGAMRMPNTAFKNSQTEVTTDVVFFRKRDQDVANALAAAPSWLRE